MMSTLLSIFAFLFTLSCTALADYNGTIPFTNATSPAPNFQNFTAPFWLEEIKHQGTVAFRQNSTYKVFRNVKDFGAKGDGLSDDTAAINLAMSSGNRCGYETCQSSTLSPAIVYFPSGTYRISAPINDFYYTQIIGNPNGLPIIKATPNFTAFALIDGNPFKAGGAPGFENATAIFYRQIRNLVLDTTDVATNLSVNCIHWPTAQATSLQNLVFRMSEKNGTKHEGLFIESGSGGFMADLKFHGGFIGAFLGNQQFTLRNISFYNAVTAITQLYDWGWTYKSISIHNCGIGLNMSSSAPAPPTVGSVTFFDSYIENTPIAFLTDHGTDASKSSNGSLILENVRFKNVETVAKGTGNFPGLAGKPKGEMRVEGWAYGHSYNPDGPNSLHDGIPPFPRPGGLTKGEHGKYYERSKPQYARKDVSHFLSARSYGAKGDGATDDSAALQEAITASAKQDKILFLDAGTYRVTTTIYIPSGSKIVGETYPLIMSSGSYFSSMTSPKPVVQVGKPGEDGQVEWSDMIVATQGAQAGAVLIQWNLASHGKPSGMWDVHTRIGGFEGSKLGLADCLAPLPATSSSSNQSTTANTTLTSSASLSSVSSSPKSLQNTTTSPSGPYSNSTLPTNSSSNVNPACIAAFMSMHITPSASNLYTENTWFWTADHDLDAGAFNYINIYSGRGLLIESKRGNIWLVASAVEHHVLYQYQLHQTRNIFMGQAQTETAYFQPMPDISEPFPAQMEWNDPNDAEECKKTGKNCNGWGLRVVDSQDVDIYGVGLYSFFNEYNTSCSTAANNESCQSSIFSIEGKNSRGINVYNLNTIGATSMIDRDGKGLASWEDNQSVFPDGIAVFRSGESGVGGGNGEVDRGDGEMNSGVGNDGGDDGNDGAGEDAGNGVERRPVAPVGNGGREEKDRGYGGGMNRGQGEAIGNQVNSLHG